jgi:hypothetical protein
MTAGGGDDAARIEAARSLGAAGQALFSYSGLRKCQEGGVAFLDLLGQGPYAWRASPPPVMWK